MKLAQHPLVHMNTRMYTGKGRKEHLRPKGFTMSFHNLLHFKLVTHAKVNFQVVFKTLSLKINYSLYATMHIK